MTAVDIVIREQAADGVPVLWCEAPGPFAGALTFRVGRADEEAHTAGITHLVEHLALFALGRRRFAVNGAVDATRTTFWASGTQEEVEGFLGDVAKALADLPLERLDAERRVLLTEAESAPGGGPAATLLGARYGARRFGLLEIRELGLNRLGAEDVRAWARERFTAGNAVVWLTGPPSEQFGIELPPGDRWAPPELETLPGLTLPASVARGSGAVTLGFLAERVTAATSGLVIAADRMHHELRVQAGLTYSVLPFYLPLTADVAHVTLGADCLDAHAGTVRDGMLSVLQALAADGPTAEELAESADGARRALTDPYSIAGLLDNEAADILFGSERLTPAELLARAEQLTSEEVAAVFRGALESAILVAPEGLPPPGEPFRPYDTPKRAMPAGRTFRAKGQRRWSKGPTIVTDETGVGLRTPDGQEIVVPFDDCPAVVRSSDGWITLIARDNSTIEFVPAALKDGDELLRLVEQHIPAERFVEMESADTESLVRHLAREKLSEKSLAWSEVEHLSKELGPAERVVTLGEVEKGLRSSLLAVTTTRIISVSSGMTGRNRDIRSFPLHTVTEIDAGPPFELMADGARESIGKVVPPERAQEIADLVRAHIFGENPLS